MGRFRFPETNAGPRMEMERPGRLDREVPPRRRGQFEAQRAHDPVPQGQAEDFVKGGRAIPYRELAGPGGGSGPHQDRLLRPGGPRR